MKKYLIVLILLLIPTSVFAKEVTIRATISPSITENITEIVVSLEDYNEPEGTIEYSLYKTKNYVTKVTDYRDSENGKFVDGTIKIDNKIDFVNRYEVTCTSFREYSGAIYMDLLVTDTKATTTTQVTTTQQSVEKKEKKANNMIAYGIIAIIVLVFMIFVLIFLGKAIKASNMY